ncbi:hypothetical protein [Actinomadura macra]|uniref:hypothetical protein n=1 Tax=Actinomadura macra TaxID=46164 RepID=UPI000B2DAA82|nr:hypothetical protein [Actinomadura macra]
MTNHQNNHQRPVRAMAGDRPNNALIVAERSFLLLASAPSPLSIDGRAVGHGLPPRPVDLQELQLRLLEQGASDELKDAAWRELLNQARTGDPAWIVGCIGVAMPGLKGTAARVIRSSPSQLVDDIISELLTEFVAQLTRIDTKRPHIAARLMLWARKGALRARGREDRALPCDPTQLPELPDRAPAFSVDPAVLLLDTARQRIISREAAELIIATRLDGSSVQELALTKRIAANKLYKQRRIAESRIAAAIQDGRISSISAAPASGM